MRVRVQARTYIERVQRHQSQHIDRMRKRLERANKTERQRTTQSRGSMRALIAPTVTENHLCIRIMLYTGAKTKIDLLNKQ